MKQNSLYNIIAGGVLALSATACTGAYEDINRNPFEPDDLTADDYALSSSMYNICNTVMSNDVNQYQFVESLMGCTLGGYFADGNGNFTASFSRYNPANGWSRVFMEANQNSIIPTLYTNISMIEGYCETSGNPVPAAIAKVVKVAAMSRVTDCYGPIPYSAIGTSTDLAVPYDSQEAVYDSFFKDLTDATATLQENIGNRMSPNSDYVYSGDPAKWILFGNSLKLRLAMRISFVAPEKARKMAEEAVAGGVIEQNSDNASWKYFASMTNPLYTAVNYNNDGSQTGGDTHAAADIICYMNGYSDPRREAYFMPSTFDGIEYIGLRRGWQEFDRTWGFNFSGVNVGPNDPLIWMTASEVAFLRAEGSAIHNFNMGGQAEDFYNRGIELSF